MFGVAPALAYCLFFDDSNFLAVAQNQIHVLVECHERANQVAAILHGDTHSIIDVVHHLAGLPDMVANKTNYGCLLIQSVVGALSTIFFAVRLLPACMRCHGQGCRPDGGVAAIIAGCATQLLLVGIILLLYY